MILQLNKERKITLLQWLKQGYIDTADIPEAYQDGSLFAELLIETGLIEEGEAQEGNADLSTNK